jgi:hypothetical protein
MNNEQNDFATAHPSSQARAHALISRVIDGDISDEQWTEFEGLAQADPTLWRELAESQRDQASLAAAVGQASTLAERVAIPQHFEGAQFETNLAPVKFRLNRASAWSGWAVAALVAIMASAKIAQYERPATSGENLTRASLLNSLTPDESYQHYLDKGRAAGLVLGEMPAMVMVETRPAPSGQGYEVLYLRQVLERTVVDDLYQVNGQTEHGRPTLERVQQPHPNPI